MTIARISGQMMLLEDIGCDLVKKSNHDKDMSAERERTIKASLRAANKTIAILRTSCADKHRLDLLTPEEVPASTPSCSAWARARTSKTRWPPGRLPQRTPPPSAFSSRPPREGASFYLFFVLFNLVSTSLKASKKNQPSSQGSAVAREPPLRARAWAGLSLGPTPVISERRQLNSDRTRRVGWT